MTVTTSSFHSALPRDLYSAEETRQLDHIAIDQYGIEGFSLMQRAGMVSYQALQEQWPETRRILVFAGGGNNGGDAYIVAGLAKEQGLEVQLVALRDPNQLGGDANLAWQWAEARGVECISFAAFGEITHPDRQQTVIVDGLFGTGLDREVTGEYLEAIQLINSNPSPALAIDIPSGLHADTGMPLGSAVRADITTSFIGLKQGLLTGVAGDYVGTLLFSDLDVPPEVYRSDDAPSSSVTRIDILNAMQQLQPRRTAAHKGDFGHVLIVGGDLGFGGAVAMAAEAAMRVGAGLVSVLTRSQHRGGILARRPELMVAGTEDEDVNPAALLAKASVIVVGPGLGTSEWSRTQLQRCLAAQIQHGTPLIVDADGLNLLAEKDHGTGSITKRDNWILTPHPGEAARLLNVDNAEVSKDRFAAVKSLQRKWGGNCLLKGHGSLIVAKSDEGRAHTYLCSEGNPGMATGGMGDVLAGIIAGLVAQHLPLDKALRAAVCLHGEAADLAAESGQRGMVATDLFPYIRQLVNTQ